MVPIGFTIQFGVAINSLIYIFKVSRYIYIFKVST